MCLGLVELGRLLHDLPGRAARLAVGVQVPVGAGQILVAQVGLVPWFHADGVQGAIDHRHPLAVPGRHRGVVRAGVQVAPGLEALHPGVARALVLVQGGGDHLGGQVQHDLAGRSSPLLIEVRPHGDGVAHQDVEQLRQGSSSRCAGALASSGARGLQVEEVSKGGGSKGTGRLTFRRAEP